MLVFPTSKLRAGRLKDITGISFQESFGNEVDDMAKATNPACAGRIVWENLAHDRPHTSNYQYFQHGHTGNDTKVCDGNIETEGLTGTRVGPWTCSIPIRRVRMWNSRSKEMRNLWRACRNPAMASTRLRLSILCPTILRQQYTDLGHMVAELTGTRSPQIDQPSPDRSKRLLGMKVPINSSMCSDVLTLIVLTRPNKDKPLTEGLGWPKWI